MILTRVIEGVAVFVVVFVGSILIHEYVHKRIMIQYGKNPKIKFTKSGLQVGEPKDYQDLTNKQLYDVYAEGVLMGLAPIVMAGLMINSAYFMVTLLYLVCCKSDLKQMWRLKS